MEPFEQSSDAFVESDPDDESSFMKALVGAEVARMPALGEVIDHYRLVRRLGHGGMGVVFEARDTMSERDVALKVLSFTLEESERLEARASARLSHPHIVTLYHLGRFGDRPYLVFELVRGRTLADVLPTLAETDFRRVLGWLFALIDALAHAHSLEVIHLDLTPRNIMIDGADQVRVLDFGLARVGDGRARGGTPGFMAPEQEAGEVCTAAADVWAYGKLLGLVEDLVPERLGGLFNDLVSDCLSAAAEDRKSARQLKHTLAELIRAFELKGAPFRYFSAFTEEDEGWFYGREGEIQQLSHHLERSQVACLIGASGSGKTSLVNAGLVPKLREAGATLLPLSLVTSPFTELEAALRTVGCPLQGEPSTWVGTLGTWLDETGKALVLVFDAWEKLYTLHREVAAHFEAFLFALWQLDASPRFVISLREDFIGEVITEESRALFFERPFILTPLARGGLARAFERPLAHMGWKAEGALTDALVEQVQGESSALPLLQFAASRLWEEREVDEGQSRILRLATLERLGGVHGLLVEHAESVLKPLGATHQVRALFVALVTPEGTRTPLRRRHLVKRFGEGALEVVDTLIGGRLLCSFEDGGEGWIELAHESLTREWPRLRRWLEESHQERRTSHRLNQSALHWSEQGEPDELLWSQGQIALAQECAGLLDVRAEALLARSLKRHRRTHTVRRVVVALAFLMLLLVSVASVRLTQSYQANLKDAEAARAKAEAATAQARAEQASAEGLVSYLIYELREQLVPRAHLDVLEELIVAVETYHRQVPSSGTARTLQRATVARIRAQLHRFRGDTQASASSLKSAETLLDGLPSGGTRQIQIDVERALVYRAQGVLLTASGEASGAQKVERARRLLLHASRKSPSEPQIRFELALTELSLATMQKDKAGEHLKRATERLDVLVSVSPREEYRRYLALALIQNATAHGNEAVALADLRRAEQILEPIRQTSPDNIRARFALAMSYHEHAVVLTRGHQKVAAMEVLGKAKEELEYLVNLDEGVVAWETRLGRVLALEQVLTTTAPADQPASP